MSKIVFLEACEPDGLTALKIKALCSEIDFHQEVYLLYWERTGSPLSMPFSVDIPSSRIYNISCRDFNGIVGILISRIILFIKVFIALRKVKPDIVQVANFDFLLFLLISFVRPRKIVFDLRDTSEWMMNRFSMILIRFLLRTVDYILITSPRYETEFLKKYNLISSRAIIQYIPNTPSKSLFSSFSPRQNDGTLVVGYIGTFRGKEALSVFAEGIAKARSRGIKVKGFFAGTGVQLPFVKDLCAKSDNFKYYGAYKYLDKIVDLYSQVDLIYAVYDIEYNKRISLACRLAEAIVCGIPTVVQDGTYMAEVVKGRGVGFVLDLLNPNSFANILIRVAQDNSILEPIRRNCAAARPDFLFDNYKDLFLKIYLNEVSKF